MATWSLITLRFIEAALAGLPPSSQLLATSASNVAVDNMVWTRGVIVWKSDGMIEGYAARARAEWRRLSDLI